MNKKLIYSINTPATTLTTIHHKWIHSVTPELASFIEDTLIPEYITIATTLHENDPSNYLTIEALDVYQDLLALFETIG
ncbi:MAG: hypothetical protein M3P33_00055 [bacterium]|nr:hypothetical protein [bacterium]